VSELAVVSGIPPSVLWEQEPGDLATMLDVLPEVLAARRV
jgi:hypothetical protein